MWTCVFTGARPAIGKTSHVRTQGQLCARRSVNVGSGILGKCGAAGKERAQDWAFLPAKLKTLEQEHTCRVVVWR